HFIFNCLNSIQNYIVQNENQTAAIYLSRFARLVRSTLNASVAGKISLSEEMDLLENYLSLEKLRLGDRFDFEVKIDPETDPDDVRLPPMLVQHYVENTVLHGIRGRVSGGRISIFFRENAGYLEVSVQDNGNGFSPAPNPVSTSSADRIDAPPHKSVGMSITRRRMELLEKSARTDLVQMEEIKDADVKVTGTLVRLKIKIEDC
ncbi:MAG: histidine kinase, partial [Bacteroidota bacterium]